jgi:hypothetical protein
MLKLGFSGKSIGHPHDRMALKRDAENTKEQWLFRYAQPMHRALTGHGQ